MTMSRPILTVARAPWLLLGALACSGGDKVDDSNRGRVGLLVVNGDKSSVTAPPVFRAKFETSKGNFVIEATREWAPNGADRFYYLVRNGFFDDTRFYRAIEGFMVQFGLSGDPKVSTVWRSAFIPDDSVRQSNVRGFVSYAKAGPDTRGTQLFINYGDNTALDAQGFAPFGRVVEGMEVVDSLYKEYGDAAPGGAGPTQMRIRNEGNAYLDKDFPRLDKIVKAYVVED
jgi:peptidyl-prolyl cis-trans isomerase A (cyclophilin A)